MGQNLVVAIVFPANRRVDEGRLKSDLCTLFELDDLCEYGICDECDWILHEVPPGTEFYDLEAGTIDIPSNIKVYEISTGWRFWETNGSRYVGLMTLALLRYLKDVWTELVYYGGDYGSSLKYASSKELDDIWDSWITV